VKTIIIEGLWKRQLVFEETKQRHKERKKAERKRRIANSHEMPDPKEFVLKVGDEVTKETKTMTGLEAKLENKLFILRFGSGKEKRLKMWIWK